MASFSAFRKLTVIRLPISASAQDCSSQRYIPESCAPASHSCYPTSWPPTPSCAAPLSGAEEVARALLDDRAGTAPRRGREYSPQTKASAFRTESLPLRTSHPRSRPRTERVFSELAVSPYTVDTDQEWGKMIGKY